MIRSLLVHNELRCSDQMSHLRALIGELQREELQFGRLGALDDARPDLFVPGEVCRREPLGLQARGARATEDPERQRVAAEDSQGPESSKPRPW